MLLTPIAGTISSWSTLAIPVLVFLLRPQRLVRVNWLILVFALLHFIADRLHEYLEVVYFEEQLLFVIALVEYAVLATMIYFVLGKSRNRRWVLVGSGIFFTLIGITWWKLGAGYYGSIRGTAVILLISYIIFYFLEWMTAETFEPINAKAEFWMITGALLYLSGNFFYFITIRHPLEECQLIHYLVNLLRNACFVTGILQSYQPVRSHPLSDFNKRQPNQ